MHRAAWLVVHDAAAAEDIAQEAFLAALRALDRFDRRRPLAPWLHRIVVNRAIDWARARALRPETGADTVLEAAAPDVRDALGDEVLAALADLGPEHRAVVVLRHLLGYTPGEIAAMLDLPRGTVNSRLRRALDALAVALEAAGDARATRARAARGRAAGRGRGARAGAPDRAAAHAQARSRRRVRRAVPLVWVASAADWRRCAHAARLRPGAGGRAARARHRPRARGDPRADAGRAAARRRAGCSSAARTGCTSSSAAQADARRLRRSDVVPARPVRGATDGRTLVALDPASGAVRWSWSRARGQRAALGARRAAHRLPLGRTLRIVYGNGEHDVLAGRDMAAVAPAWRPVRPAHCRVGGGGRHGHGRGRRHGARCCGPGPQRRRPPPGLVRPTAAGC